MRAATILAASLLTSTLAPATTDAAQPDALCGTGPLEILLTNDDGFDSTGIRALSAGLVAAGHRVTLAAPARNASGSSMGFTWGEIPVRQVAANPPVFAVDATPATVVVLARDGALPGRPTPGPRRVGHQPRAERRRAADALGHGRCGARGHAAARPARARCRGERRPAEPGRALGFARPPRPVRARWRLTSRGSSARAAGWFCERERVVRPRTVLNVNYPALAPGQWRGTVVAGQDSASDLHFDFEATADGKYHPKPLRSDPPATRGSDRDALARGYVTVTPLGAAIVDDTAATGTPARALTRRLRDL